MLRLNCWRNINNFRGLGGIKKLCNTNILTCKDKGDLFCVNDDKFHHQYKYSTNHFKNRNKTQHILQIGCFIHIANNR